MVGGAALVPRRDLLDLVRLAAVSLGVLAVDDDVAAAGVERHVAAVEGGLARDLELLHGAALPTLSSDLTRSRNARSAAGFCSFLLAASCSTIVSMESVGRPAPTGMLVISLASLMQRSAATGSAALEPRSAHR